jgi:N-dimethylarginine dimethylaminohydrolase
MLSSIVIPWKGKIKETYGGGVKHMPENLVQSNQLACYREYDLLKRVVLCSPRFMKIRDVINETQRVYANENIDTDKAVSQHNQLLSVLAEHGVEVILLPPYQQYPEQVFTRDIGFTLDSVLIAAQLKREIRKGEEKVLIEWLEQEHIPYYQMTEGSIEGGDIIMDGKNIWIGDSDRTSVKAIDKIQSLLPEFHIANMPFEAKYLHLDCVFNVISNTEALIFPPAFLRSELEVLANHYEWIEVCEEEQFTLGTNVLSIGNKTLLSLPINQEVNEELRLRGYEVIEVDISEIIKSGGSFRCITMPLVRESSDI